MTFPQSIRSGEVRLQDTDTVCGSLQSVAPLHPKSGLVALQLRGADEIEIEVLADAGLTLHQLAAEFGSAEQAVGQRIELGLDVFGFPTLRTPRFAVPPHMEGAGAGGDSCAFRRPEGA